MTEIGNVSTRNRMIEAAVRYGRLDSLVRRLLARNRVTIVIYHDPTPDSLRAHLRYYSQHYSIITMDQAEAALIGGRWRDLPAYPLVITIDDGHAGNARLQPVLAEFGVRPTIFLCSQIIGTDQPFWWKTKAAHDLGIEMLKEQPDDERRARLHDRTSAVPDGHSARQALSWAELEELSGGADFGAHTRTHPILTRCRDADCATEILDSRTDLETALGRPCRHFAYPNGSYGEREVAVARRTGFATARTIEAGWNGPGADPLRLKAILVSDGASVGWLRVQMTEIPGLLRRWTRRRHGPALAPASQGAADNRFRA